MLGPRYQRLVVAGVKKAGAVPQASEKDATDASKVSA
jgi:hypothetical protein